MVLFQVFINFVSKQQEIIQEAEASSTISPGPPTELQDMAATHSPDCDDDTIIDLGTSTADSSCPMESDVPCLLDSTTSEDEPLLADVSAFEPSAPMMSYPVQSC